MKFIIPFLIAVCSAMCVHAQYGSISVLAGSSCYGYGGDGGPATAACLHRAHAIALDTAGNIYFYDEGNARIRKIYRSTGIIATIAGDGHVGYSGDGGPGPLAKVGVNITLATDLTGNLYIGDEDNHRIRKVDHSSGYITTIAGNGGTGWSGDGMAATAIEITHCFSVYIDAGGNVFYADEQKVKKIDASSGIVSTVAGNYATYFSGTITGDGGPATDAHFDLVTGIVGDDTGNIYFCENTHHTIRKVDTTGIISTIGGGGTHYSNGCAATAAKLYAAYSTMSQLAIDSNNNIYFLGEGISKIDQRTGMIHRVGPGAWGMFVNRDGVIYYSYGSEVKMLTGASSVINMWTCSDTMITSTCSVPTTVGIRLYGLIDGTPASTDSLNVSIDYGSHFYLPRETRTYRLPYWYASGSYGFGSRTAFIDTFSYGHPGEIAPHVTITTLLSYQDADYTNMIRAVSTCSSALTMPVTSDFDSSYFNIVTPPCTFPAVANLSFAGYVFETPSSIDSVLMIIDYGDSTYDVRTVPFVGDSVKYQCSHSYALPGIYAPFADCYTFSGFAVRLSSLYSAFSLWPCLGGAVTSNVWLGHSTSSCRLPDTVTYNYSTTLSDSAQRAAAAILQVNFGDGTSDVLHVPVHPSGYDDGTYVGNTTFTHVFTMPGIYSSNFSDSAGIYTNGGMVDYLTYPSELTIGASCSPVSGVFYIDTNASCTRDITEVALGYWPFGIINNTLGDTSFGWCDTAGRYTLNVIDGYSYTIVSDLGGSFFYSGGSGTTLTPSCPSTGIYTFTATSGSSFTHDFAFTCASPTTMDMSVSAWGWGFVPGDTGAIGLWSSNAWGYVCDTLSSNIRLVMDSNLTYFGMWSGPAPTSISGDTLTWHFTTMGSLFDFNAVVKVVTDTTATIFDTIHNNVYVSPTTIADPDLTNNSYGWSNPVISSWDPNEKQVSPQGFGAQGYIPNNTPLSYIVHFQNTGSAPARNITVADTIDANLDIATLQVVSSSSSVLVFQFGNVVKFRFNDIYLPDSTTDPSGSIGYIAYNIIPHDSLAPGTQINNKAGIYFDYNPAVYTNATINTIEDTIGVVYGIDSVCAGSGITLTNHVSGGLWSSSNVHATVSPGGVVTGVIPGLDTITYTLYGHQTATKIIRVLGTAGLGTISGSHSVCTGSTIALSATIPGGTWSSSGAGIATVSVSGVVTGVTTGNDTVFYTVAGTCGTGTVPYGISVVVSPVAGTLSGPTSVCASASISLASTATGGTWSASNASATVSGGVVSGVTAGTDTIFYTVTNACGSTAASAVITIDPIPVAGTISGSSTVCVGSTTTLSATVTGGLWSVSSLSIASVAGGVVTALSAGIDTVFYTVTNVCGSAIANSIITVIPMPVAGTISGASNICAGSATTFTTSVSGGAWTASNSFASVSGGIVTGISAGADTIFYTVTNTCGSATDSAVIIINPLPIAGAISGSSSVCAGSTITLSATVSGGVWSLSSSSIASVSGGVVTAFSAGTDTVFYTVTNICGSAAARSVINIIPMPFAGTISGSSGVCVGLTTALTTTGSGGAWSVSSSAIASVSGGVVAAFSAGVDTVFYNVTNSCGTASTHFIVTVNPLPFAGTVSGASNVCVGSSDTLTPSTAGGVWLSNNPALATISSGIITGVSAGSDTIWYIVSNSCGSDTAFTPIIVLDAPSAGSITGPGNVCVGSSITLTSSTTGGTWSSSSSHVSLSAGAINGISAGSATITYTVVNICGAANVTRVISIDPLPDAGTITGADTICEGTTTTLIDPASGGSWNSSNTSVAIITATGVVTGVSAGSVSISYAASNTCGTLSAISPLHVNALADCPTEIKIIGRDANNELTISPNPNTGIFVIEVPTHNNEVLIFITDAAGKSVKTLNIANNHQLQIPIDMTNYAAGVYLIKAEVDGRVWRKKVVVM